jgi:hypothetical protein
MTMNENENNFEPLRRLLALKKHEIPPPGYFDKFSGQVTARIRAGGDDKPTQLFSEAPWLLKLLQIFEAKPAFAVTFASSLCLLLLFGTIFAERPESAPQPVLQMSAQSDTPFVASVSQSGLMASADQTGIIASTNPVLDFQPSASLFSQPQNPLAQQVSFTLPGN